MSREDKSIKSIVPGNALAAKVQKSKRFPNGDITRAIGKWKRALKDSGKIDSLKENREYTKPSVTRRAEIQKAKYSIYPRSKSRLVMAPEPTLLEMIGLSTLIGGLTVLALILINKVHLYILKKFSKKK